MQRLDFCIHVGRLAAWVNTNFTPLDTGVDSVTKRALETAVEVTLHPHRSHPEAVRRLLVFERVLDQHAAARPHLQPRQQAAKHARVGFGAQLAEHRHVVDADHGIEVARQPQRRQHPQCVGTRRIGQHDLAPAQPGQRGAIVCAGAQPRFQPRQAVGLFEEVVGLDAVVAHQAEQRRAVVVPVVLAQGRRALRIHPEVAHHVRVHRRIEVPERRVAGVVQRVVQVEQPDPALHARAIRGAGIPGGPSAGPLPSRPAPPRGLSPDTNSPGD